MLMRRRPWDEELAIIDRTMKAISGIVDPEELISVYWNGIGDLLPVGDYVSVSRRHVEAPSYLITRSSRFTEHFNPWTHRERLPKLVGGLLGEIAYGNKPVIWEDLPDRLKRDDPAWFYLQGFQSIIALPQYDGGEALNVTAMLFPAGFEIDRTVIPMMHWQSGLFGRGTQNLVLRNQLTAALADLDRELQAVGDIQRSLLPATLPQIPGFNLAANYETSARAGGDYYDFFPLPGPNADGSTSSAARDHNHTGHWGLFIADVSGHGTPAAVLMAITHAIAHAQPGTHCPPAALLTYLNAQLTKSYTRSGAFITAFYGVLDPAARTLTYSIAGHNPPRLVRPPSASRSSSAGPAETEVIPLDQASALPLGIVDTQLYTQATIRLEPGDLLLLYTDGITEASAPIGSASRSATPLELFGTDRLDRVLRECLEAARGSSSRGSNDLAAKALECVRAEVATFTGNAPPSDDQTLIAIACGD